MEKIVRGFNKLAIKTLINNLEILSSNDRIFEKGKETKEETGLTEIARLLFSDIVYITGTKFPNFDPTEDSKEKNVESWNSVFSKLNHDLHTKLNCYFNDDKQPLMFLIVS